MIPGAMASEKVEITALADVDQAMIDRAVEKTGITAVHKDYREVLERDDVDLVYIATPNFLHHEQVVASARANKHILCEKPMASTSAEGEAMVVAARENHVFLAVNYMTRFHVIHQEARRLFREGALGQLYFIRSHWSYYKPGGKEEFRLAAERQGGGPLADIGCYSLDVIRNVVGQEVAEVRGVLGNVRPGWGVHDAGAVALKLKNGVAAYIDATFDFFEAGFEIVGEKGMLVGKNCFSQDQQGTLELVDNSKLGAEPALLLKVARGDYARHDMYQKSLEYFVECIEQGVAPDNSGEAAVRDLWVLDTVYRQNGLAIP
jgi:predicted dehydrogenase